MRIRSFESTRCLGYALLAVLLAWAAQAVTVYSNFGGNWSALYQLGDQAPPRPEWDRDSLYIHAGTKGYDGQFYRLLAHDPLLARTSPRAFDSPRMRRRRILVPALAWLTGFGRDSAIDYAYPAVILGFLAAGVYWTARFAIRASLDPAWGLCFLLLPAAAISVERMTVDIALAALAAGFALYADEGSRRRLWAVAAAAPLARETGIALPAALFLERALRRDWRGAIQAAAALVPWVCWSIYVQLSTPSDHVRMAALRPFRGLWLRSRQLLGWSGDWNRHAAAAALDDLAIVGVWLLIGFTAYRLLRGPRGPVEWALGAFLAVPLFVRYPGVWTEMYAFGRIMTPALLWLALIAMRERRWLFAVPAALMLPRMAAQWTAHVLGELSGVAK